MKVLFYIPSLALRGGMENVTILKANALSEIEGVEVAIAFADDLDYRKTIIRPLAPKVKAVDLKAPFRDSESVSTLGYLKKLNRLRKALQSFIDTWHPDIVVSTGLMDRYVFPFLRQTSPKYVKVLEYHFASNYKLIEAKATTGKIGFLRRLQHWFDWKVLSKAYDFNALLTGQDLEENAPAGDDRFGYVHNPSTIAVSESMPESDREKIVLAAGRLTTQKGFESLLRIWKRIKDKDSWRLRIVGDGELRDKLRALVSELGLEDSVELPGFIADVRAEMVKASIFVATSRWEGLPLVQVEALAAGCPAVSFRTPYGPADILDGTGAGILVGNGDESAFARELERLMMSPETRAEMGAKALERARDFLPDKIIGRWMNEYRRLIDKKRRD